jgi:hypothetical protein
MSTDHTQPAGHPDMDYAEHERTYQIFLRLVKYTIIGVVTILILLAIIAV